MGIRIHKTMGWGKVYSGKEYVKAIQNKNEALENKKVADYKTFLEERYNISSPEEALNLTDAPMEYIFWDKNYDKTEIYHLMNVIDHEDLIPEKTSSYKDVNPHLVLFTPLTVSSSWNRSDDDIDYNESTYRTTLSGEYSTQTELLQLPYAPYPYEGTMNAKTGEQFTHKNLDMVRLIRDMQTKYGDKVEEAFLPGKLTELLQTLDFTDLNDFNRNVVPNIPKEIKDMVEWLNVLTNPEEINNYRPMIVKYWE